MLRDRVAAELGVALGAADTDLADVNMVRQQVTDLVAAPARYIAPEMLLGGRFNLNRPFVDINDRISRNTMAQQLYVLMLLVGGPGPTSGLSDAQLLADMDNRSNEGLANLGLPYPTGLGETAVQSYRRAVAQWAVNVVDFMDSDSVMTVFEYDINPFNDDPVDNNIATDDPERGIVVGMERPELLISETFHIYDRQNEDLDTEPMGDTVDDGDMDWDSRRVPLGAMFIELVHPHLQSPSFQLLPSELGSTNPAAGVDVQRCLLYTSPSPRDQRGSRMPSSA